MKLLLLTYQAPPGGDPVCRAITGQAARQDIQCVTVDLADYGSQGYRQAVQARYRKLTDSRHRTWNLWYKAAQLLDKTPITSPLYLASAGYAQQLGEEIGAGGYDAVVCVNLYAMEAMRAVRVREGSRVPCWGLLTEYYTVPFLRETGLDGYFVPHEAIAAQLAAKGVPRVFASGVPLQQETTRRISRREARNYLVIPQQKRVYLVLLPQVSSAIAVCDALLQQDQGDFCAYVPFERQDPEADTLCDRYRGFSKIHPIIRNEKGNQYLSASDAVICSPNGPLCADVLCHGVPMVLLKNPSGYGVKTADFLARGENALMAASPAEAAQKAIRIIRDTALSRRMIAIQKRNARPSAAKAVVETIVQQISSKGR